MDLQAAVGYIMSWEELNVIKVINERVGTVVDAPKKTPSQHSMADPSILLHVINFFFPPLSLPCRLICCAIVEWGVKPMVFSCCM